MKPRTLVLALMTAGSVLPGSCQAADDYCTRLFVYAVNQFCSLLPNGQKQCQPIGLVGPAPGCTQPGDQLMTPLPLSPPVMMMPPAMGFPFATYPGNMPPATAVQAMRPIAPPPPTVAALPKPVVAALPPATPAPLPQPPAQARPADSAASIAAPAPIATPKPLDRIVSEAPAPAAVPTPATPVAPAVAAAPVPPAPAAAVAQPAAAASTAEPARPAPASTASEDALAHFAFNSAELTDAGRATLDAWLARAAKGKKVHVTGHADRLGGAAYNLKLSRRRAEAVKLYLIGKGMDAGDIQLVAKGEAAPVKRCPGGATPAVIKCLSPNRRVEIDPE